jgi:hypothetical protein
MIPHPFSPQECDNAEMDQDSKPLQHRKDQRVARGRAVKKRPQVRLTPTDILKLLPPPIVLPGSSLTAIERQLSRRRERLERAMNARTRQDFVPQSRNLQMPSVVRLEGLLEQIETLPTRRKCLTRAEFRVYLDTVLRVRDAIVVAIRKIRQSEQRDYQQRYLARVGQIFLDAPPDVLEGFILTRRNQAGRNVHAAALARMRSATPQQLSEWGRRSAEVRRQKRALIAAAGPTSSPSVASANESATASALESE